MLLGFEILKLGTVICFRIPHKVVASCRKTKDSKQEEATDEMEHRPSHES